MRASSVVQVGHFEAAVERHEVRPGTQVFRRVVREPLVHFLLLGALTFVVSALVTRHRDDAARRIVIDRNRLGHFVTLYQAQMGTVPSQGQLDAMIEDYVREEVQFREARRMGLGNDDEIVRRRLASKFDFLQRDLLTVAAPSAEELRRYYASHAKDFLEPATVTFTHIYFSPDRGGDAAAHARAARTLVSLQSSTLTRAPDLGDRFALQTDYAGLARLDVVQQFGDGPMVERLFAGRAHQWSEPVRSGYGWHLVYLSHREEARVPQLEEIPDKVRAAYLDAAKEQANQAQYDVLAKQYTVDRAYLR